jgi:hypothetical protein
MKHSTTEHRLMRAVERSSVRIIPFERQFLAGTLEVAREIHAHSIYADMPMDEAKLITQLGLAGTVSIPDRYFKLAVRGDDVLGGFYGCVSRAFFCDEILARDMGWWVKESARGGLAAVMLLADFEQWAREHGARKCMVGQSGVERIDQTLKLFEHCGYRLTGYNTAKEL